MRAFAAVCLLLLMAPARAADGYTLDPETSRVRFQLHALGWWPVRGEARAEGVVTPEDERLRIDVRVPLASLQMGREGYRDWALSPEFFWAARHPELLFQADTIAPADLRAGGEIRGELQVRERRRVVRFALTGSDCSDAESACRVQAEGELSRREFGMRSRRLTLGDRIRIELDLHLVATP